MIVSSRKPFMTTAIAALAVALLAGLVPDAAAQFGNAPAAAAAATTEKATLAVDFASTKKISDTLFGIFFEDINYAADGGLYAELIRNRDFEFSRAIGDSWDAKTAWTLTGAGATFDISEEAPISKNNRHYAVLNVSEAGTALVNEGFRGIPVKKGAKYDFSLFAKNFATGTVNLKVSIIDDAGKVYGTTQFNVVDKAWQQISAVITATDDCKSAKLSITPAVGKVGLDMISLFPQDTFKGRKNGLRKDLAQALADLKPKFIRFPGGCVAHSGLPLINGQPHSGLIDNPPNYDIYYWKDSVGKLEDRLPIHNRWGYHQTRGLGYYEYMLFCEDIGAAPLPILPCGVDCQFTGGGQKAVPLDEMPLEVQNVLDLVEFANGSVNTKWGKLRADMGHPQPFNLKYIGLGNEETISEAFRVRFKMIFDALKEKCPEITVVGTVGPSEAGRDFNNGWNFARTEKIPVVDEHFYQPPEWFVNNAYHRYDKYDRNSSKVYAGEYAAHERGQRQRRNTVETALDEAVFLTGVERNGDVVVMSSYAPLFSKQNDTQWYPDMIVFNNNEIIPTTTYEVHKMFSANAGTTYVNSSMAFGANIPADYERFVVASVVRDGKDNDGDIIIKLTNVSVKDFDITIDLSKFSGSLPSTADCQTISGTWKNTDFKLDTNKIKVGKSFTVFSKGGSLNVIRIPVK